MREGSGFIKFLQFPLLDRESQVFLACHAHPVNEKIIKTLTTHTYGHDSWCFSNGLSSKNSQSPSPADITEFNLLAMNFLFGFDFYLKIFQLDVLAFKIAIKITK